MSLKNLDLGSSIAILLLLEFNFIFASIAYIVQVGLLDFLRMCVHVSVLALFFCVIL